MPPTDDRQTVDRRTFLATSTALALGGCLGTVSDRASQSTASATTTTSSATTTAGGTPTTDAARWRASFDTEPVQPASGQSAFIGAGSTVYAFDHSTGEEIWSSSVSGPVQKIALGDERLYVVTESPSTPQIFAPEISITAFRAVTGEYIWSSRFGKSWLFAVRGDQLFIHNVTDVVPAHVTVSSINGKNGRITWKRKFLGPKDTAIRNDRLFMATADGLYSVNRTSGDLFWRYPWSEYQYRTLVASPDVVAGIEGSFPGDVTLHVLEWDGHERWSVNARDAVGMTLTNGMIYTGGRNITAYDADTGVRRWTQNRTDGLYHAPTVSGVLLAGGNDVQAYDLRTGEETWTFSAKPTYLSPAIARDGSAYVRGFETDDGGERHLFKVNGSDGHRQWHLESTSDLTALAASRYGVCVANEAGTFYSLT